MSGRIVFVPEEGTYGVLSNGSTIRLVIGGPLRVVPAPTAADIDALVTDEVLEGISDKMRDEFGLGGLSLLNDTETRWLIRAALRELLGPKS